MRNVGFVLIVLGILGLIAGGLDYRRSRRTVHVGPLEATIQERDANLVPPILGGVALLAGLALVVSGKRSRV